MIRDDITALVASETDHHRGTSTSYALEDGYKNTGDCKCAFPCVRYAGKQMDYRSGIGKTPNA